MMLEIFHNNLVQRRGLVRDIGRNKIDHNLLIFKSWVRGTMWWSLTFFSLLLHSFGTFHNENGHFFRCMVLSEG